MNPIHYIYDKLYPVIRFVHERVKNNHWYTQINPNIVLGGAPTYDRDFLWLLDNKVTAVINIRAEREDDLAFYGRHDIDHIQIKVLDMLVPNSEQIERAVDFTNKHVAEGGNVLIHCAKGRSRSALLVASFLMKYENMTYDEAHKYLLNKRRLVSLHGRHRKAALKWWPTTAQLEATT